MSSFCATTQGEGDMSSLLEYTTTRPILCSSLPPPFAGFRNLVVPTTLDNQPVRFFLFFSFFWLPKTGWGRKDFDAVPGRGYLAKPLSGGGGGRGGEGVKKGPKIKQRSKNPHRLGNVQVQPQVVPCLCLSGSVCSAGVGKGARFATSCFLKLHHANDAAMSKESSLHPLPLMPTNKHAHADAPRVLGGLTFLFFFSKAAGNGRAFSPPLPRLVAADGRMLQVASSTHSLDDSAHPSVRPSVQPSESFSYFPCDIVP